MSYAGTFARHSALVFFSAVAGAVFGYVLRLFLARNLAVADFGLFYAILAFVGLFALFKDIGLSTALVKFISGFAAKNRQAEIKASMLVVTLIQTATALAITVPIIIFADTIAAAYFKTASAALPLQLIAISFLAGTFMVIVQNMFQGLSKIKHYAAIEPVRIVLALLLATLMISYGIAGVSAAYVIAAIAATLFGIFFLFKEKFFLAKAKVTKPLAKKLLLFGLPVFIGGLSSTILSYTDTITLTVFRTLEEVGAYQAALPTAQLLWFFVNSVAIVLLPAIAGLWAKNERARAAEGVSLVVKFAFIIVMPAAILMFSFPEIIIRVLFGDAYLAAVPALQMLSAGAVFYAVFLLLSTALIGIGKPALATKITISVALFDLFTNVALVPLYGIAAAAFTTAFSYFIGAVLAVYYSRRYMRLSVRLRDFGKILTGGILAAAIVLLLKNYLAANIWLELALSVAAGLAFYTIFIFASRSISRKELEALAKTGMPFPRFLKKAVHSFAK